MAYLEFMVRSVIIFLATSNLVMAQSLSSALKGMTTSLLALENRIDHLEAKLNHMDEVTIISERSL